MLNRIALILVLLNANLFSQPYQFEPMLVSSPVYGNQFYIQPEFSHATYKTREIKQNGYLYGIRGGYDLLVFNNPYLGFECYYRSGVLKGSSLSSKYKYYLFEGKIGFTMGIPTCFIVVPFAGIGYENEKNDYKTPPVEKLSYYYLSAGLYTQIFLNTQITLGCNMKVKFPFCGDHDVKNSEVDERDSCCKKIQYNIEFPVTYWASSQLSFSAIPFYESRKYGNNSTSENWKSKAKMSQYGLGIRGTWCF
jgi:hypothetical protein